MTGNLCPVCASPDTPIATPTGERPIADLRVGDLVYTTEEGAITIAPLVQVGRTPVQGHRVVRVVLAGGRVLDMSGGHPPADGRTFSDLHGGSVIDGHPIVAAQFVPYSHAFTYDILPASRSGNYFAAGVLVGSTLAPSLALSH